jgi:hypothetical protein
MTTNKKSFSVIIKNSKAYNLIVTGFEVANTLLFHINDKIKIHFTPKFLVKIFSTISLGKLNIIFNNKVTVKIVQVFRVTKVSIVFGIRQKLSAVLPVIIKMPITFISHAIQKIVIAFSGGKLVLTISMLLTHFYTLGYFDPNPLSVEDTQTLGQMDYTIL